MINIDSNMQHKKIIIFLTVFLKNVISAILNRDRLIFMSLSILYVHVTSIG